MKRSKKKRTSGDLVLEMRGLEVARATDGLLRGKPEPVVMVAAYALEEAPRVLGRALWRFSPPSGRLPATVAAVEPTRPIAHAVAVEREADVLVLAVGIEEDSGDDVRAVYGLLERTAHLSLWDLDDGRTHPSPLALHELGAAFAAPSRVRVLVDGADLGMRAPARDDWVGACAVVVPRARLLAEHRLHLADEAARNDWTALLKVRAS